MPTINQLSAVDQVVSSDQVPIYSSENGDARKASMAVLLAFVAANLPSSGYAAALNTQRAVPSAAGFNALLDAGAGKSIWLILTPTIGLASGTITLPAVANCVDQQEVLVNCTQQITALTVNGNGATAVTGAPSSLGADDFFRLRFDAGTKTWYRVG